MAVSGSQVQDDCATTKEPCHSGEPSQMGEVSSEVTCEWKSTVHLQARLESWLTWEWKSMVHLRARLEQWVALWVKVNGAFASTSWEVADLRVKVNGALASMYWEVTDLRVKVNGALASMSWEARWLASESLQSFCWPQQGDTGTASKSGYGTSRSSGRGRGGGRSWRGVVEAAVEVRLIIWAQSRLLMYPRRLEE